MVSLENVLKRRTVIQEGIKNLLQKTEKNIEDYPENDLEKFAEILPTRDLPIEKIEKVKTLDETAMSWTL